MSWFKSKRTRDIEELLNLYREKIAVLERQNNNLSAKYICIAVPQETDMEAYWTRISSLITDPFFVFYLSKLRRDIIDRFESSGENKAEYFRGMLTAIGQIFLDARSARSQLEKQMIPEGGKDAV
jgi:hypothetical protein